MKLMPWKSSVKEREYQKNYYLTHKTHLLELAKRWRNEHPERCKELRQKGLVRRRKRYHSDEAFRAMQLQSHRKNALKRLNEIRQAKIAFILARGGKCEMCGFSVFEALELHHVLGNREKNYTRALLQMLNGEVPCQVLCANCHTLSHKKQNSGVVNGA